MSSENEEKHLADDVTGINDEARRKSKISYTRDFLLSFSDLDVCKKLPSGFESDRSLLSEFGDDRHRTSGGLPLNSLRRNEYGSSPPTRGDLSGYSRGIQGRWESRSSGRSDRDSDAQSDWDSDSSRRHGNQSWRSWQVPEHDGLLGSGSFPRPSGYAAGASATKVRPNEHYQLNRSNESYQPPRPYKAVPHSRRDTDAFNNETFGSSECTSEDRVEEERKRRASFELMRKEQQKTFQDRQKLNLEKKDDFDISTLVEESKEENRSLKTGSELEDFVIPPSIDNDAEKSSTSSQTSASRPLVPPGFACTAVDRSSGAKSLTHSHTAEAGNGESEDSLLLGKRNSVVHTTSDEQEEKQLAREIGFRKQQSMSTHASINDQSGKGLDKSPALDVSNKTAGIASILYDKTNITPAFEASKSSEVVELNVEKVIGPSILGDSNQDRSTSILDKLFSSSLTLNDAGSSAVVHHDSQVDETLAFQSSKFACWFGEEEKQLGNDQVSGRPNDLLSLIVGEKGGIQIPVNKNQKSSPNHPFQNSESADRLVTPDVVSATVGSFDQLHKENKAEPVSAVLTCEDLEQSMLSEISVGGSISQPPVQSWTNPNGKIEQPKSNTDNLASQHLLSLLQKGSSLKDTESSSNLGSLFSGNVHGIEEPSVSIVQNTREAKIKNSSDSANTLTLETLFGSAFMKELQSVGAPVSSQRGPTGSAQDAVSEPHGFPFPVANNHESGFSSSVLNAGALSANTRKQSKVDKIEEPWLKFDDFQAERNSSQLRTNFGLKVSGFNAPGDVRLPEEDSLIASSDPPTLENFMPPGSTIKTELPPSSNAQMDFAEKLGAFNTACRDERPIRGAQELPFHRGPYDMREPGHPFQNPNVQPSFAQLHQPQLNNIGAPLPRIDPRPVNINSQMKFMAPEAVTHHDAVPNHQMQMNMRPFHRPGTGLSGFDQPIPHAMLQQMHMQGNFPPNLLHGLRGPSLPQPPNRSAPIPAHPNFGNPGMPLPGPDVSGGSSHQEALQRLIEMELRSNPKPIHPFTSGGQSHGKYEHELDMGFGFR